MATSNLTSRGHAPTQSLPTLSCEFCRHRKIKCDKLDPCTACQKAGVKCESIRRKRLPRGRHITKSESRSNARDSLKEKIDRLEALVNVALSESDGKGDGSGASVRRESPTTMEKGASSSNSLQWSNGSKPAHVPMNSRFWASVINEIRDSQGLAADDTESDDVDDEDGDDDVDIDGNEGGEERQRAQYAPERTRVYLPFMGLSLGRMGHTLPHSLSIRPSPTVTTALCDIYLDQVDRIIKVLHRPSLKRHFSEGIPYPVSKSSREAGYALDTAVFYAAVASMTDRQCCNLFQCSRKEALPEYQSACEMALERADLMRTTDMTVLQAFVLYLVC